jgi:hypothetical protein
MRSSSDFHSQVQAKKKRRLPGKQETKESHETFELQNGSNA